MAQYDVFKNPEGKGYLLDVQSDLLEGLNLRVVVPLIPKTYAPVPASRLNPIFVVGDQEHAMMTQYLSSVPEKILKTPVSDL